MFYIIIPLICFWEFEKLYMLTMEKGEKNKEENHLERNNVNILLYFLPAFSSGCQ